MNRTQALWAALVLTLCVFAGIGLWWNKRGAEVGAPSPAPLVTRSPEELEAAWRAEVERVIAAYEQNKDAAQARGDLLRLVVPGPRRDLHLSLVLALDGLVRQESGAEARWQQAVAAARAAF